jgi:hypothetical protein
MEKKTWEKPKLIVLFRGRPEEAVLQMCKQETTSGPTSGKCNRGGGTYGFSACSEVRPS